MASSGHGNAWQIWLSGPVERTRCRGFQDLLASGRPAQQLGGQVDRKDLAAVTRADAVFHFASNRDIAKVATQSGIDFWEGTYLTQNLVEAMRFSTDLLTCGVDHL
jgi:hypothetical protein